ncbi:hypothetical protein [Paraglaciecola sp.]|uniref:hypothetical protein n=1 Tax=Paraglaciecola sp. TaxID=1920173 RepID=UPI003EF16207
MKTLFTKPILTALALTTLLFAQSANAKLENKQTEKPQIEKQYDFDLLVEINTLINQVMGDVEKPSVKKDIAKQLKADRVQLKADELIQQVDKTLPKFKFKVVIKD